MRKRNLVVFAIAFVASLAVSCNNEERENGTNSKMSAEGVHSETTYDAGKQETTKGKSNHTQQILKDYFNLKNALVADDNGEAKEFGATLAKSLGSFDASKYADAQQSDLKDIVDDAVEHAEHISESEIGHQREHFKVLSKDLIDMIAITGSENTLYQQFCPMYDGGSAWLSTKKEIKNPYYGSQMLNCGKVEREIN